MNLETLETLKKDFINVLDWNEEEGVICVDDGFDIRDFLEAYAQEIANKKGLEIEITDHEYPLYFSDDNSYVDFQLLCEVKGDIVSDENSNYLNIDFDSNVNYSDINYDSDENITYFTLYTSINIEEKLEELKNKN